jgi:hypothetical protein
MTFFYLVKDLIRTISYNIIIVEYLMKDIPFGTRDPVGPVIATQKNVDHKQIIIILLVQEVVRVVIGHLVTRIPLLYLVPVLAPTKRDIVLSLPSCTNSSNKKKTRQ